MSNGCRAAVAVVCYGMGEEHDMYVMMCVLLSGWTCGTWWSRSSCSVVLDGSVFPQHTARPHKTAAGAADSGSGIEMET